MYKQKSVDRVVSFVVGILFLIYVISKAFRVGITWDEAFSFYLVKTLNINYLGGTANTHWLNSVGILLFTKIFQSNHISVIRLQSIAGFIIYLIGIGAFTSQFRLVYQKALFLAVFLFNPYVLDFFVLARGYSLSMGLQMLGFYYIYCAFRDRGAGVIFKASICLTLAVAANYSTLYIYLACSGIYSLLLIRRGARLLVPEKLTVALLMLTILIAVVNLFIIRQKGDLWYGGNDSFVKDTLGTLISSATYSSIHIGSAFGISLLLFVFLVLLSICFTTKCLVKRQTVDWYTFIGMVTLVTILISEVLHFFFKTPYLINRTSLVLYPLLGLTFCFYLFYLGEKFPSSQRWVQVTGWFIVAMLVFNFSRTASLQYVYDWKGQQDTYHKLERIIGDMDNRGGRIRGAKVYLNESIGVYTFYYSFLQPDRYAFLPLTNPDGKSIIPEPKSLFQILQQAEYAILTYPRDLEVLKKVPRRYTVVQDYPDTYSMLIRFD